MWLRNLLSEIGLGEGEPTELYCDNNGAIASTHDPHGHSRMKHIDIRYHYIRDCVNKKFIEVLRVDGSDNSADIMTKALGKMAHLKAMQMLRIAAPNETRPGSRGGVSE